MVYSEKYFYHKVDIFRCKMKIINPKGEEKSLRTKAGRGKKWLEEQYPALKNEPNQKMQKYTGGMRRVAKISAIMVEVKKHR